MALVLAPAALAHTTPAVLGPAGPSGDRSALVRISHGLAARDETSVYRFVCPAAWGGPERPLAAGGFVVGEGAVFRMRFDVPEDVFSRPADGVPVAIASDADAVRLVVADGDEVVVRRFGSEIEPEWWRSAERVLDVAAVGARTWLAVQADDGGLRGVTLDAAGGLVEDRAFGVRLDGASAALEASAGNGAVRLRDADRTRVLLVEEADVTWWFESEASVFGPLWIHDRVWLIEDGRLLTRSADMWSIWDDTRRLTCLVDGFACTLLRLYAVNEDGVGAEVFSLEDLRPPRFDRVADPAVRASCEAEWLDLAAEARLPLDEPDGGTQVPPRSDDPMSCRAAPGGASWGWWVTILTAGLATRRRRKVSTR